MKQFRGDRFTAVRRLFSFISPDWLLYTYGMLFYCAQGFLYSYFLSLLVGWISAAMLESSAEGIGAAVVKFALMFAALFVFVGTGIYSLFITREKAVNRLKTRIFSSFMRESLESLSGPGAGIVALNTEANQAASLLDNASAQFIRCLFSIALSMITLFAIDWRLGLLSIVNGAFIFWHRLRYAAPSRRIEEERLSLNEKLVKLLTSILEKNASIRAYQIEDKVESSFNERSGDMLKLYIQESLIALKQSFLGGVQKWVTLLFIWGVGGYLVATGELSFAALMMAPFMANEITNGLGGIGLAWVQMQAPLAACKKLEPLLNVPVRPRPGIAAWNDWNCDSTLRTDGLSFRYKGAESLSLSDISFTIEANRTLAVVGRSGSGKSTLLRAVVGLFERQNLPFRLGNVSFEDVGAASWREKFAFVDQTLKLFNMTIAENISLGNRLKCTEGEIAAAAAAAGADAFIRALPDQYNTVYGAEGVILSGGQKQRLAIARALARQAPVLALDEPTSSLDPSAVIEIMQTLRELKGKKTILIATHDLRLAKDADLVLVLAEGGIAQAGTHDELMKAGGEYAFLWNRFTKMNI